MLTKSKSKPIEKVKFAFVIPLLAAILAGFYQIAWAQETSGENEIIAYIDGNKISQKEGIQLKNKDDFPDKILTFSIGEKVFKNGVPPNVTIYLARGTRPINVTKNLDLSTDQKLHIGNLFQDAKPGDRFVISFDVTKEKQEEKQERIVTIPLN